MGGRGPLPIHPFRPESKRTQRVRAGFSVDPASAVSPRGSRTREEGGCAAAVIGGFRTHLAGLGTRETRCGGETASLVRGPAPKGAGCHSQGSGSPVAKAELAAGRAGDRVSRGGVATACQDPAAARETHRGPQRAGRNLPRTGRGWQRGEGPSEERARMGAWGRASRGVGAAGSAGRGLMRRKGGGSWGVLEPLRRKRWSSGA